jgi:calcium-dependent protein kinase
MSGGELFDRCQKNGLVPDNIARTYISSILYAIKYCHAKKVIHGDIKLENVLFEDESASSELKLIDFDTSKIFKDGERLNSAMGTPHYMAPEIFDEYCEYLSCLILLPNY